jgi:hypothetical protein
VWGGVINALVDKITYCSLQMEWLSVRSVASKAVLMMLGWQALSVQHQTEGFADVTQSILLYLVHIIPKTIPSTCYNM